MVVKKINKQILVPSVFHPFLWSYDVNKMDLERDKKRIITNVLNFGTVEATDKLFKTYSNDVIKKTVLNPFPGEWNKKSLNFWSLVFSITPIKTIRNIK